jgi:hypothetical protein
MLNDSVEIASILWENGELTITSEKGEEWTHRDVSITNLQLGQKGTLTVTFQRYDASNNESGIGRAAHEDDWDD